MKTDAQLQMDVLDELRWDPRVGEANIDIEVQDGVVTLTNNLLITGPKLDPQAWARLIRNKNAKPH